MTHFRRPQSYSELTATENELCCRYKSIKPYTAQQYQQHAQKQQDDYTPPKE